MTPLGDIDLYLIGEGRHEKLWEILGSHLQYSSTGEVTGTSFAVWAPNARAVSLICDANYWDRNTHKMSPVASTGIWEIFIPEVGEGLRYKYAIQQRDGRWIDHADPLARRTELPPLTASVVFESNFTWNDRSWIDQRSAFQSWRSPVSIYEVHLGSWKSGLNYVDLATELIDYVKNQGFTHVEFLPVMEHPYGPSWGYQVTSFFAPTSRFGSPDEFRHLVDEFHQANIGVILDWVPAHFPKDEWALAKFDGTALYEHSDPRLGEHPDWGTLIFNFGRTEVKNFLLASALFWLSEFHIDGLRVDAVASMLYLDYSRKEGEWLPNKFGGRENLEAVQLLQEATSTAYRLHPGIMMIAEESTAWTGVSKSTDSGGLGFGYKWNMGWMHDTLSYLQEDPINRVHHHNEITFSILYAWSENYVLPISHDEVVHGKASLVNKFPGDRWQKLATLRALYGFMWAHPGKKLLFMGCEFAQSDEWDESMGLQWHLTQYNEHQGIQRTVKKLNEEYLSIPALWEKDTSPEGFTWLVNNDGASNILAFVRWDDSRRPLVSITNFSPVPHEWYELTLPLSGKWREVMNTDDIEFGGTGISNAEIISRTESGNRINLRIPPLATLWLQLN
ncbi:MAG: 1,4-alpha-glucan branching protein GlgB [Actinobacteria bacterium]|nr:1,4-alpha-glucan branching protein GlgB [Actinomycetota bacterium]